MKDIAIIGVAGRFPEASNIEELYQNLKAGRDSSRKLSRERLEATTAPVNKKYHVFSWLNDIDKFDHKFFNISLAEAQNMDPHQRLMLEVAYETFESSGYDIDHFYGSNTAVYSGDVTLRYYDLAERFDPTLITGNTNAMTAGRIARFFNLRGSTMMIDTNCSSTLVATHVACNELRNGDAEHALICGVRLVVQPEEDEGGDDLGIMTRDGKTKSFSASADGTGAGEAVAAILLKPLDKAIADNDIIYAVIKGSAINQEAQLSGSLTAPSSTAQAECIRKAWEKSGVDPLSISYIEPHGSGTKLGDPIEIQGIDLAYKGLTDKKHFVSVSALKSNIGHTDTVAGLAGMIKVILSFQHKELFPSLHFDEPNPFIDFDNSVTSINTTLKNWDALNGQPRRAGVSSFGISGTNCHMIVEEPPLRKESSLKDEEHLLTISSRTAKGLAANIELLKNSIEADPDLSLSDISHTLNRGKKHYNHRVALISKNLTSFKTELEERLNNFNFSAKAPKDLKKLFFIFSDNVTIEEKILNEYNAKYLCFNKYYTNCIEAASGSESGNVKTFAFQYAFYKLLEERGIATTNVLGLGLGRTVIDVISGTKSLSEGIQACLTCKKEPVEELEKRLNALVERETGREKVAFLEIGTDGTLIKGLKELNIKDKDSRYEVFDLNSSSSESLLELFKALYTSNFSINWKKAHPEDHGKKIKLPAYRFESVRCWLKEPLPEETPEQQAKPLAEKRVVPQIDITNFDASAVFIDPEWTLMEQKIARFWVEVLKLDEVNLDDDFFRLGGHSLIATQLISRIENEFGVRVAFKDVSVFSTIRSLAIGVEQLVKSAGKTVQYESLKSAEEREYYPLSAAQKRLWIMDRLEDGGTTYNLPGVMVLEGKLDKTKFDKAFVDLAQRHQSLRTSFRMENGEPVQIIHSSVDFQIKHIKASEDETEKIVNAFIRPFNLEQAPLFRVELVEISSEKHLLLFDVHHIVSDGVSSGVIISDFVSLYSEQELPELKVHYKDFAVWQESFFQSEPLKAQENYWLDKLSGELPVLNLPTDYARPAIQCFEGDRISLELSIDDTKNLKKLCRDTGATVYMTLLAAYNILLHKYTGQEDVIVGSVIAGRTKTELESIVGMFVNTLAMRNQPAAQKKFVSFLEEVKSCALEAYSNQDYPFEAIVNKLGLERDMSRNPLFDTLITYQNFFKQDESAITLNELSISPYAFENKTSKFDLMLEISEGDNVLNFNFEYSTRLFKRSTIERLSKHFVNLLRSISANRNILLSEISLFDESEKEQVYTTFNKTRKNPLPALPVSTLFEQMVEFMPSQIAVVSDEKSLTYSELNTQANKLAHKLKESGVGKDSIVNILIEPSVEMFIGIFGVLKAGGAYLPIDVSYPKERIQYIIEETNSKWLLTRKKYSTDLDFNGEIIDLTDSTGLEKYSSSNPNSEISLNDLAYVIYTSGSTGKPKGVAVEHNSLLTFCGWAHEEFKVSYKDRVTKYAGTGFDASILEIFPTFISGATLYIVPHDIRLDMHGLNNYFEANNVSIAFLPTQIAEQFMAQDNKSLRILHTGGDKLKSFKKHSYQLVDHYGPTENTVVTSAFKVDKFYDNIPVGKPVDGTRIYMLDKQGKLQPIGIPGELCIAGNSLARGYLNQPELTSEKFVTNPFNEKERMYRTGDLARWLPDGNIEFLGRMDQQVKIRGYRIELGEIENILREHPQISEAVVIDLEDNDKQKYLCAYYKVSDQVDISELKVFLSLRLPEYMIPAYFIALEHIPLNANGKIDKKALPRPDKQTQSQTDYIAPVNETEEQLVILWQEILGVEKIGTQDNFFSLGGHSLKATQLIARIHQVLETEVPLRELFRTPTIQAIAHYINNATKSVYSSIEPIAKSSAYQLSSAQKRMYVLSQIEGAATAYNMPAFFEVEGSFDVNKFESAFKLLIKRHESLRTSFVMIDGEPMQIVHDEVDFKVFYKETTEEETSKLVDEFMQPFDLSQAPLLRISLLKKAPNLHVLMFDMNHIISDGTSMSVLVSEFMAFYERMDLAPLKIQYKDFAAWQIKSYQDGTKQKNEQFWLDTFKGEIPTLELPTDFARPAFQSFEGTQFAFELSEDQLKGLKEMSVKSGVTMYMLLLATYNVLLSKYSGQEDIVVGSPVSGRPHADLQNIIGMFVNTLALRNYPNAGKTFKDFLEEVKTNSLEALEHQDYQFEDLVKILNVKRDLSRNPIFDTTFTLQNISFSELTTSDLEFHPYAKEVNSAKFDIFFEATESENNISIVMMYASKLFKHSTIERMAKHYSNIVTEVISNPEILLSDIDLLSEKDKQQLIFDFNKTATAYPKDKTIAALFEEQTLKTPAAIAVVFDEQTISYADLNAKANQLAKLLQEKGVASDVAVGIIAERSTEMIIGLLAILKAGGAYLPIDSSYPKERINYMLRDAKASLLLVQNTEVAAFGIDVEMINITDKSIYTKSSENLKTNGKSSDLAYVLYTSGSTGQPKGVLIEQKSVVRLVKNTNYIDIKSDDRIFQTGALTFDASTFDIWGALLNGASLYLAKQEQLLDASELARLFSKYQITTIWLTASFFNQLVETDVTLFKGLNNLLVGGDRLSQYHINKIKSAYPNLTIINGYGPTENTTFTTCHKIDEIYETEIPIGKPISNTKVYILGKQDELVPVGIAGEICITGDGLARGYLNAEELTAAKFVVDPFNPSGKMYRTGDIGKWNHDGVIEFVGRKDHQVKIRGYRIELGEIENRLLQHDSINEAVVIDRKDENGNKFLCAYFVSDKELSANELREFLALELPDYMLPTSFVVLDKIPLNHNGKTDRNALPLPTGNISLGTEYVAPTNEMEEKLCLLWQEMLGIEKISIFDNFFELGGHSLKAMQMASNIHKIFNASVSLTEIFSNPTIAGIARFIATREVTAFHAIEPVSQRDFYPLSAAQKRMFILNQLVGEETTYNMPGILSIKGDLDKIHLENVFKTLVQRHQSLRTGFEMMDGQPIQRIYENIDFKLNFIDANQEQVEAIVNDFIRPFDLSKAPLFRVGLICIDPQHHVLMFDMHHIISDGTSMKILTEEFMSIYQNEELPELKLQYKDFAVWQNELFQSDVFKVKENFWLNSFSGEIPMLNLPTDYARPIMQSFEGANFMFTIDAKKTAQLRKLSNETGTTLFMVLLAEYNLLLAKYSGQNDIVVGTPVAGRLHADLQQIIGMFVNTLALRNYPSDEKSFRGLLNEVKSNTLKAFEHQDYPFEELVEKLSIKRDLGRNPLFDTMFALQNIELKEQQETDLTVTPFEKENTTAKFDLFFEAKEQGSEVYINISYCSKLFKQETIERFANHFINITDTIIENPDIEISELSLVSEKEKKQLLVDFTGENAFYPGDKTLIDLFEVQVSKRPNDIAVVFEEKSLSYKDLNEKANALGDYLRKCYNIKPDDLIGIKLERSEWMIISILGVLKSGGAYVPMDPDFPVDRIEYMLSDSQCKVLIDENELTKFWKEENKYSTKNLTSINKSTDLAYVIYTSGSTGRPKGCMLEHKGVINRIEWQWKAYEYNADDIILQKTTFTFDVSVWEIFMPLCWGTKMILCQKDDIRSPERILKLIDTHKVTCLHFVPSMLNAFINDVFSNDANIKSLSSLNKVVTSGEALSVETVKKWYSKTDVVIHNLYGPTEASVDVTYYETSKNDTRVPIGRPIWNTQMYVLDPKNQLLPIGILGEICIGGDGLARGYLNKSELTEEKFIAHPFKNNERIYKTGDIGRWLPNGDIEYVGRKDHQVKIRGYRIELGEIENQLLKYKGIKEAVVIDKTDSSDNKFLCAYYVSENELTITELREYLSKGLPDYMIPSYFILISSIPLNSNGKVDRKALPEPDGNINIGTEYVAPENETEKVLAEIWQEILGVQNIGTMYNFFELGGHSLKAVSLISKMNERMKVNIPLTLIFNHPTIKQMAAYIKESRGKNFDLENDIVLMNTKKEKNVFAFPPAIAYSLVYSDLARKLTDHSFYGFNFIDYKNNLSIYVNKIMEIQPEGPYTLFGYSAGGNLAFQVANELSLIGKEADVIMIDAYKRDTAEPVTAEEIEAYAQQYISDDQEHPSNKYLTNDTMKMEAMKKIGNYFSYLQTTPDNGEIEGNIYFIRSQTENSENKGRDTWNSVAKKFKMYQGAGEHGEMLDEANFNENFSLIREILNDMSKVESKIEESEMQIKS